MKILLAPDVYVNASVAGAGLAPAQVVDRVLGNKQLRHKTSDWVLDMTEAMLRAHPHFKQEAVGQQMKANNYDFTGELASAAVDNSMQPLLLEDTTGRGHRTRRDAGAGLGVTDFEDIVDALD